MTRDAKLNISITKSNLTKSVENDTTTIEPEQGKEQDAKELSKTLKPLVAFLAEIYLSKSN